jgi:hypothetical protein
MDLGIALGGAADSVGSGVRIGSTLRALPGELERQRIDNERRGIELDQSKRGEADELAVREAMKKAFNPPSMTTGDGVGPPQDARSAEERMLDAADAGWQAALGRGNKDIGLKHFQAADQIRGGLLTRAMANADRRAAASGGQDLRGYVDAYNRYVPDGGKIEALEPQQDGTIKVRWNMNGQATEESVPKEGARTYIDMLRDPAAVRKILTDRAEFLWKERNKVHTVAEGGIAARGDGTVIATNPKPDRDRYTGVTYEDADGNKTPGALDRQTGRIQRGDGIGVSEPAPSGDFSNKRDLPVHKEIDDIVMKMPKMSTFNPGGTGSVLTDQGTTISSTAKNIYQQATTLGGARISPQESVNVARYGKEAPEPLVIEDGGKRFLVRVVEYNGRYYPMHGRDRWRAVSPGQSRRAQQGDVRRTEPMERGRGIGSASGLGTNDVRGTITERE